MSSLRSRTLRIPRRSRGRHDMRLHMVLPRMLCSTRRLPPSEFSCCSNLRTYYPMREREKALHAQDDPRLVRFRDGFWFSGALLRRETAELENLRVKLHPDRRDDLLHAVATVWQIVDAVHRVRELAQAIP